MIDSADEAYWEAAGGEDLEQFGEFVHIDKMAREYNYTHSEAFELSWSEFITIIVLSRRREVVEHRFSEIKRKANESNKR